MTNKKKCIFYFRIHVENSNNDEQPCQPPLKRIRLVQQLTDDKSFQDEDNASDMSQDE